MIRASRPTLAQKARSWALTRRACQRIAVAGALAVAVSSASWTWAVAAPPISAPQFVRHTGPHAVGQPASVYGMTDSQAAGLRVALNNLFAEHVYLAARATGAALGNRQPEFEAAAAALDANSVDISRAIGMAYGPDAEAAFLPLWRAHIGMVVDYTTGKATQDQAKQDKAVQDLIGYTQDFGAFLSDANENLPKDVVAGLVKDHVLTLKDVIDAQAAGDPKAQFTAIRAAGHHMGMIADPLAEATAVKFPTKFQATMDVPAPADHRHGASHQEGAASAAAPLFDPMADESLKLGPTLQDENQQAAEIRLFGFRPDVIEVPVGATVTWTNQDAVQHSVTSTDGVFDSGFFSQGGTYSQTFDQPGTYAYYCMRHTSMHGEVHVAE
jgi:plastocyanin